MIYAGVINFTPSAVNQSDLIKALGNVTTLPISVVQKNGLVLCYGNLSSQNDVDEVWENDNAVLLGRIFDKEKHCAVSKEQFKTLATGLMDKIWGKYVYFNVEGAQYEIVLDITGHLPFFYYPLTNGNVLFASDIEIIFRVLAQKPEFNWRYLCSYVTYGNSCSIETPFKNIYELPPACSLQIKNNEQKIKPSWNPLQQSSKGNAVTVLKNTLTPWIEPYETICVSLSGGLDSSSLVYCLKDIVKEGQNLKAVNYFHSQIKSSNELVYARKVCEETGIELIEIDLADSLPFDDSERKLPVKPNKPFPGLITLTWLETLFNHIPVTGSFAFISGHGSDHIFMRPPSKRSIADYFIEKGISGYKNELDNISQFYRDPLFTTFKESTKGILSYYFCSKPNKRDIKKKDKDFPKWIKQELLQQLSATFVHPIYEHLPQKILPGKHNQIDAFYEGLASIHMETINQGDPSHFPFLYQPVVEYALAFPTYELFSKGYDRYPLRRDVSEHFKTETVWRRDKSETTGLFQRGVQRNLKKTLDICLEGQFVKHGLVDKEGLEHTIRLISSGDNQHLWPFLHLASTELFLSYWGEKIV